MTTWTDIVVVHVPGTPVPQGSLSRGSHGGLYHSNSAKLKAWRSTIARHVGEALPDGWETLTGAVRMRMLFAVEMSASTRRKYAECAPYKPTMPDLDKLVRAVGDALTKIVYVDDGQIVELAASKVFADESTPPGLTLRVQRC